MRILFDHGTPVPIRNAFVGHTVKTALEAGWDRLSNGELLKVGEDAGFDVLLTTDQNLPNEQNLKGRKLAIVVLNKADWRLIRPEVARIVATVLAARPGSVTVVAIPGR